MKPVFNLTGVSRVLGPHEIPPNQWVDLPDGIADLLRGKPGFIVDPQPMPGSPWRWQRPDKS